MRLYFDTAATMIRAGEGGGSGGEMLDQETAASGENSGLTDQD